MIDYLGSIVSEKKVMDFVSTKIAELTSLRDIMGVIEPIIQKFEGKSVTKRFETAVRTAIGHKRFDAYPTEAGPWQALLTNDSLPYLCLFGGPQHVQYTDRYHVMLGYDEVVDSIEVLYKRNPSMRPSALDTQVNELKAVYEKLPEMVGTWNKVIAEMNTFRDSVPSILKYEFFSLVEKR